MSGAGRLAAVAMLAIAAAAAAASKPAVVPAGVSIGASPLGRVYVGKDRRTLYGLSIRSVRARTSLTLTYCTGSCAQAWTPLKPASGATPVGGWTIVTGAQGPQWAFEGAPVFSFNADRKPGDTGGDRWKDLFTVLAFVPPKPVLVAPPAVDSRLVDDAHILTDSAGHILYASRCGADCGTRAPFAAGAASLPTGEWSILRDRDRAQWAWRGLPVFVATEGGTSAVPVGDTLLKP